MKKRAGRLKKRDAIQYNVKFHHSQSSFSQENLPILSDRDHVRLRKRSRLVLGCGSGRPRNHPPPLRLHGLSVRHLVRRLASWAGHERRVASTVQLSSVEIERTSRTGSAKRGEAKRDVRLWVKNLSVHSPFSQFATLITPPPNTRPPNTRYAHHSPAQHSPRSPLIPLTSSHNNCCWQRLQSWCRHQIPELVSPSL